MGYTHYWNQTAVFNQRDWDHLKRFVGAVLAHLPEHSASAGGHYEDAPLQVAVLGSPEDRIWIEGFGRHEGVDLDHESFVVEKDGSGFQFCKTARKPYDLVVATILLQAHLLQQEGFLVSTDGDFDDWSPVFEYHNRVAGEVEAASSATPADIRRIIAYQVL